MGVAPTLLVTQMGTKSDPFDVCVLMCGLCASLGSRQCWKSWNVQVILGLKSLIFHPWISHLSTPLMKEENAGTRLEVQHVVWWSVWKTSKLSVGKPGIRCFLSPIPSYQWYSRCFWVKWPSGALLKIPIWSRRWSSRPPCSRPFWVAPWWVFDGMGIDP